MSDALYHSPVRLVVDTYLKVEEGKQAQSMDRIKALEEMQQKLKTLTDFVGFLRKNNKPLSKEQVDENANFLNQVAELMPAAIKGATDFDAYSLKDLVNKMAEKGEHDKMIQYAYSQIEHINREMAPPTNELSSLFKDLEQMSGIMSNLLNSYVKFGENIVNKQRV